MSEHAARLLEVCRTRLEQVMRHAVRSSTARVAGLGATVLPYHSYLPGRTLARFKGWALLEDEQPTAWSCVLKLFQSGAVDPHAEGANGAREILAYRSLLLASLPGTLRAPRLLAIDEDE